MSLVVKKAEVWEMVILVADGLFCNKWKFFALIFVLNLVKIEC